jgi:hypothetical protein
VPSFEWSQEAQVGGRALQGVTRHLHQAASHPALICMGEHLCSETFRPSRVGLLVNENTPFALFVAPVPLAVFGLGVLLGPAATAPFGRQPS